MIKLSTKGRYGTRLMLNLALHYNAGQEPVILKNVSKEEEISIRYLEQIIIPLKLSKLVKSIRGAGGGYILTQPPPKIKLIEIIEALEGPIALVDCVDDLDSCDRMPRCATYEVWKEATNLLRDYLSQMTLQDLVEKSKKKNKPKTK
jgi:Rrf2 family protein